MGLRGADLVDDGPDAGGVAQVHAGRTAFHDGRAERLAAAGRRDRGFVVAALQRRRDVGQCADVGGGRRLLDLGHRELIDVARLDRERERRPRRPSGGRDGSIIAVIAADPSSSAAPVASPATTARRRVRRRGRACRTGSAVSSTASSSAARAARRSLIAGRR